MDQKLDHKPEGLVKIAGLTLKSEVKNEELPELFPTEDQVEEVEAEMGRDISYDLKHLIERAGGLPSTDATIKAIAKLKGALELLNS